MFTPMSDPPNWGPPARRAPPGPTRPYPSAPPPDEPPTVQLPVIPHRPPAHHPTAQYGTDDFSYDRYDDYRDDRADREYEERPERRPAPRRPRGRGRLFAMVVLVLAVVDSVFLGTLIYQVLAGVDLTSGNPLARVDGQLGTLGVVALGAAVIFVLALIAFVVARPKLLAGLGLLASVLLPVGAVLLGIWYGGDVLAKHVDSTVSAAGPAAVDAVARELERRGIDIGPLRNLLPR
jgi:hypothetical protein